MAATGGFLVAETGSPAPFGVTARENPSVNAARISPPEQLRLESKLYWKLAVCPLLCAGSRPTAIGMTWPPHE